ncbi:MAG TPA: exo-beta-N-acetylmuramidase NamZ domain-containing protein, partial [Longimicrobium sp.]|nr:exo-beta-N-acetylmuramidase NamZ domain-containing protein [Longimicrobium sp.]
MVPVLRIAAPAAVLGAALAWTASAGSIAAPRAAPAQVVRAALPGAAADEAVPLPGIDVLLRDSLHLVRGRRVGLITNQTAVTRDGRSDVDVLHATAGVRLVALYAPEHGIRGTTEGGEHIGNGRDARTGIPVFSLYGATQRPTSAMLAGVDVLVFDIQDIGARPYTYVWTMTFAMEEAAKRGIPFIVLDRPNPVTARTEGPLMHWEMRSRGPLITGAYP